jgi:hypothetical protein
MAEHGLGPHGEHGSHPAPFPRNDAMTDGVDAAMQTVQPAFLESMLDGAPANAQRVELRTRDDAVLTLRERRDLGVRAPLSLTIHDRVKLNRVGHGVMVAWKV